MMGAAHSESKPTDSCESRFDNIQLEVPRQRPMEEAAGERRSLLQLSFGYTSGEECSELRTGVFHSAVAAEVLVCCLSWSFDN